MLKVLALLLAFVSDNVGTEPAKRSRFLGNVIHIESRPIPGVSVSASVGLQVIGIEDKLSSKYFIEKGAICYFTRNYEPVGLATQRVSGLRQGAFIIVGRKFYISRVISNTCIRTGECPRQLRDESINCSLRRSMGDNMNSSLASDLKPLGRRGSRISNGDPNMRRLLLLTAPKEVALAGMNVGPRLVPAYLSGGGSGTSSFQKGPQDGSSADHPKRYRYTGPVYNRLGGPSHTLLSPKVLLAIVIGMVWVICGVRLASNGERRFNPAQDLAYIIFCLCLICAVPFGLAMWAAGP